MAQEVGAGLGVGEILQRSMQEIQLKFALMDKIHTFVTNEKT